MINSMFQAEIKQYELKVLENCLQSFPSQISGMVRSTVVGIKITEWIQVSHTWVYPVNPQLKTRNIIMGFTRFNQIHKYFFWIRKNYSPHLCFSKPIEKSDQIKPIPLPLITFF
jgi:hypothetical protein